MVDERLIAGVSEVLENLPTSKSMIIDQHPEQPGETRMAIGYWAPSDRHSYLMEQIGSMAKSSAGHNHQTKLAMAYLALPDPRDFIDENWPEAEKEEIAEYLDKQPATYRWMGWSSCRICGEDVGSVCKADTKYIFPEGFSHYVLKHSVKPPQEFIHHVKTSIIKTF